MPFYEILKFHRCTRGDDVEGMYKSSSTVRDYNHDGARYYWNKYGSVICSAQVCGELVQLILPRLFFVLQLNWSI